MTNTLTTVGSALTTAGAAAGFFAGVVDEVRIWSVARTAAQIAAAKDTEITGAQAGLLGRWGLNEASGSTAADSSGNTVTGALVGSPTRAAGFNGGSSQYVTLGSASELRSATFTVELWFQRTGAGTPTSTGTGGITNAIPLITKGRAEAETAAADVNYFLGIDATSGKLVADFEEAQSGGSPSANHPITGNTAIAVGSTWHHRGCDLRRDHLAPVPRRRPGRHARRRPAGQRADQYADDRGQRPHDRGSRGRVLLRCGRRGSHLERRPDGGPDRSRQGHGDHRRSDRTPRSLGSQRGEWIDRGGQLR